MHKHMNRYLGKIGSKVEPEAKAADANAQETKTRSSYFHNWVARAHDAAGVNAQVAQAQPEEHGIGHPGASIIGSRYVLIAAFIVILAINVWMRSGLLGNAGFFEPDGFYHYSVIRATVANGFNIPITLNVSGITTPRNMITEPEGFYWVTLGPYYILRFFGVSYYSVMRLVPLLFGILDAVGAYVLVRVLARSRTLSLLAMLFVSISSGDVARTAALVYRGDGFVTIFMIATLLLAYKALTSDDRNRYVYALAAVVVLALGMAVWDGAPFMEVVYMLATLLIGVYAFVRGDTKLVYNDFVLIAMLLVTYLLEHALMAAYIIRAQVALSSVRFFLFYVPVVLGIGLMLLLLNYKRIASALGTVSRLALVCAGAVIIGAVLLAFYGGYLGEVAGGGGAVIANSPLGATIEELQPPGYLFLWDSFGFQLYLAPIGAMLFIMLYNFTDGEGRRRMNKRRALLLVIVLVYYSALFFVEPYATGIIQDARMKMLFLALTEFVPIVVAAGAYVVRALASSGYDAGVGVSSGMTGFIAIVAYFAVTMYLQLNAQRFNSLVAVPMAILAAYAVYAAGRLIKDTFENRPSISPVYFYMGLMTAIILIDFYMSAAQTYEQATAPSCEILADCLNTQFLAAMTWLRYNTPANATVLALWPDGSVVEGWADRASVMDSVGGQNANLIGQFGKFLFNSSTDARWLYSIGKPQYIVSRAYWMDELAGVATEGQVQNEHLYGYVPLSYDGASTNAGARVFAFNSSRYNGGYETEMVVRPQAVGVSQSNSVEAYVRQGGSGPFYIINSVLFLNYSNHNYSFFNTTIHDTPNATTFTNLTGQFFGYAGAYGVQGLTRPALMSNLGSRFWASVYRNGVQGAQALTLFLTYNGSQVSSAALLGSYLPSSNFFKMVFLCNTRTCAYGNSRVALQPVFQNGDTTIYKVIYGAG